MWDLGRCIRPSWALASCFKDGSASRSGGGGGSTVAAAAAAAATITTPPPQYRVAVSAPGVQTRTEEAHCAPLMQSVSDRSVPSTPALV